MCRLERGRKSILIVVYLIALGVHWAAMGNAQVRSNCDVDSDSAPHVGLSPTVERRIYVSSAGTADEEDGSRDRPFRSLQAIFSHKSELLSNLYSKGSREPLARFFVTDGFKPTNVKIILLPGKYGQLTIKNMHFRDRVTVTGEEGQAKPEFTQIDIEAASGIEFRNILVMPSPGTLRGAIVKIISGPLGDTSRISLVDSEIRGVDDISHYSPVDWLSNQLVALQIKDSDCIDIERNHISNVRHGLAMGGQFSRAIGNTIEFFAEDGIRFMDSNLEIRGNLIRNGRNGLNDPGHHDGMQGFPRHKKGLLLSEMTVENVLIEDNVLLHEPVYGYGGMQGISYYDGNWEHVRIRNNFVRTDAWHGISLYGGHDIIVESNTVLRSNPDLNLGTWLRLRSSKQKISPTNFVIRDNIVDQLSVAGDQGEVTNNIALSSMTFLGDGVLKRFTNDGDIFGSNVLIKRVAMVFRNYVAKDFRARVEGPAGGKGYKGLAPLQ